MRSPGPRSSIAALVVGMSLITTLGALSQEAQEPQQEVTPLPPSTNPANRAIYPGEGQTQEQQLGDQLECYRWATQQTGWDPYQAYDELVQQGYAAQQSAEQAQGGLLKGAAGGALMGLAIGAIAGDAGRGAAIGAAAGGIAGGARSRRAQQAAQQQADQAVAAFEEKMKVWDRNYVACMQGHDYTVN